MKKRLIFALTATLGLSSLSAVAQSEVIVNEDFTDESLGSLPWTFNGDASDSDVLFSEQYNIANKGHFLRLGYHGTSVPSSITVPNGSEASISAQVNFLFGYQTNFGYGGNFKYEDNTITLSDSRVTTDLEIYGPGLTDTINKVTSVSIARFYNIESAVQDPFFQSVYEVQTSVDGVPANGEIELINYDESITFLAYNNDSTMSILGTPESMPTRICGPDPGFGDFSVFQAWASCMQNAERYFTPTGIFTTAPLIMPGIDDVNVTRFFEVGCTNPDALNYNEFAQSGGQCVLPEDLRDIPNAPVYVPEGIDTLSEPIQETIISEVIEFCDLDYEVATDQVSIASQELFVPDSVRITWNIEQGENTYVLETEHYITSTGNIKAYLTIYCEQLGSKNTQQKTVGNYNAETFGVVFNNAGVVTNTFDIPSNELSFYPNPVSGNEFTLSMEANWEIYTTEGELLDQGTSKTIKLTNISNGTYILNANGQRSVLVKL